MNKKSITLLLLTAMLTSMFASCGGTATETTADTAADTTAVEAETTVDTDSLEGRKLVDDGLGDRDFGGEDYRMIYQERYGEYQYVEELTGDSLDDAIYNRNMNVEDRFNAKIVHNMGAEEQLAMDIKNSVLSGNDEYDLYMGHTIYTGKYAVQGIFRDMRELEIDFSKPWYPQYGVQNLTLNGKMFLAASDICLSLASNTYCYYFNKDLVIDNGLEDPYTVVNDGRWTIDYMLENLATIYQDLDGDGIYGDTDLYGVAGEKTNSTVAYMYSFEIDIMNISDAGEVSVTYGSDERSVNGVEKLKTLLYGSEGSFNVASSKLTPIDLFTTQNAIFVTGTLSDSVSTYRDECDFDYGIIPYPKYEESQANYYTVAGGSVSSSAIPMTVQREEIASVMFAALSAETWKTVIPQYYDVVLKYKGARDEASIAMIDTILEGRNLSYEFFYDAFTGFFYKTAEILKGNVALPTYVQKMENTVTKHYETVRDLFFPDMAK